ncbi:MAG TPA: MFS transporter [Lacisediminihabitans sp.]|uniref:MFS transporter n=1 Tax=Lacisediminihabitans sp. TaxID=2787631 RepID=UPI002EDB9E01
MTAVAPARSPIAQRDFSLIWWGGLVSDTGDWLLMIALPLFVFAITGSALGASTVFLAELIPVLLFGPVLGVLVDRFDHRRTMIVLNLAQGLALLPLLAASADRLWIVYLVAAVQAALAAGVNPARQSLLPRLVSPGQLGQANSLLSVADNLARLVGSPLGGLVFAGLGLPGVVCLDAASYLLSAVLVLLSRPRVREAPSGGAEPRGLLHELLGGWRTIRRVRPLGAILLIECVSAVAQGVFLVLFVVYVVQVLRAGDAEVGLLRGVQAIGGILGGLLVGVLIRRLSARVLVGYGFVVFGLLAWLTWNFAPISTLSVFYVGFFVAMGIPAVATTAGVMTTVQQVTPPAAIGRVVATTGTLAQAAQGVGLLAAGLLSDRLGVIPVLDAQASLYLVCGLLALLLLRTGAGRSRIR